MFEWKPSRSRQIGAHREAADRRDMTPYKLLKELFMGGTKLLSRMARDPELKQDELDALLEDAE